MNLDLHLGEERENVYQVVELTAHRSRAADSRWHASRHHRSGYCSRTLANVTPSLDHWRLIRTVSLTQCSAPPSFVFLFSVHSHRRAAALLYAFFTKNVDPLYWAAHQGRNVFRELRWSPRSRSRAPSEFPKATCIFAANHTSSADAPAVVGAIPRRIAILLKSSLFDWPIVGQAFHIAHFIPVDRHNRESAIESVEQAIDALRTANPF